MNPIEAFAQELVKNGFRVFTHPGSTKFLFAADADGNLGYVQEQLGVGYRYTTVHKPNAVSGTGFCFSNGSLRVDTMRKCCRCIVPEGFSMMYAGSIKKWDLDKWIADNPQYREMTSGQGQQGLDSQATEAAQDHA